MKTHLKFLWTMAALAMPIPWLIETPWWVCFLILVIAVGATWGIVTDDRNVNPPHEDREPPPRRP